ncbi:hypothetical protein FGO68_gene3232 [Halteria grandinella]|uniref:Uncharacterized protein n=1 Tax=Halteria grandinella TaxID=5974 RepID=A0A8J8T3R0_HALGN|nr:hypothetical protein FGO68_gene3232 [Halteria grandinella]
MSPLLFSLSRKFRNLMVHNLRLFYRIVRKMRSYRARTLADLLQVEVVKNCKISLDFFMDLERVKALKYIEKVCGYHLDIEEMYFQVDKKDFTCAAVEEAYNTFHPKKISIKTSVQKKSIIINNKPLTDPFFYKGRLLTDFTIDSRVAPPPIYGQDVHDYALNNPRCDYKKLIDNLYGGPHLARAVKISTELNVKQENFAELLDSHTTYSLYTEDQTKYLKVKGKQYMFQLVQFCLHVYSGVTHLVMGGLNAHELKYRQSLEFPRRNLLSLEIKSDRVGMFPEYFERLLASCKHSLRELRLSFQNYFPLDALKGSTALELLSVKVLFQNTINVCETIQSLRTFELNQPESFGAIEEVKSLTQLSQMRILNIVIPNAFTNRLEELKVIDTYDYLSFQNHIIIPWQINQLLDIIESRKQFKKPLTIELTLSSFEQACLFIFHAQEFGKFVHFRFAGLSKQTLCKLYTLKDAFNTIYKPLKVRHDFVYTQNPSLTTSLNNLVSKSYELLQQNAQLIAENNYEIKQVFKNIILLYVQQTHPQLRTDIKDSIKAQLTNAHLRCLVPMMVDPVAVGKMVGHCIEAYSKANK